MASEGEMSQIKAVIFDLGGVLYRFRDYKAFIGLLNKAHTDPVIREKVLAWETGDVSTEAVRDILEDGIGKLPDDVSSLEDVPFESVMGKPFDKIWDSIDKLRENKVKVAMLTNNGWWTDKKEKSTIISNTEKFDVIVESCRVGLRKPDPKIFDIVLQKLNLKPNECVFIDDLPNNVEGASKLGINAIQMVDGNEDLVLNKLSSYTGIKF
ncbi:unnamed protein product [Bursaphelenchus xylophilus]|uniref:(pine wood nematode) hypothetical protein n=1 Tax=Bursaphelenchus xylophilus TaxID=6326 RepID=A0A1I7SSK6_BURXY|nr:unnamed protein product [Bursaphelenchus xylophilus]CAG9097453.1 unnamed protein product [Bursaphelenchus xylophilus]